MGYIRHNAIVVTGWQEKAVQKARRKAIKLGCQATEIMESPANVNYTFLIPPDGSKEGWPESNTGDSRRYRFRRWLNKAYQKDLFLDWVEVSYGTEGGKAQVVADVASPWEL